MLLDAPLRGLATVARVGQDPRIVKVISRLLSKLFVGFDR